MLGEKLTFLHCTGAQRLQGSRGCPGFGTVTAAERRLVDTRTGDGRRGQPHLGERRGQTGLSD